MPAAVETTTTTAPATTTTTAAPTATTSIPTDVDFEVSIGDDTVWWDVLDVLAEAEQDCIIEALGDEFESLMDLAVLSGDDEDWQAPLLACLDPDTTRELYVAIIIAGIEQVSCLQDALAGIDWAMFIDGPEPEDSEAAADFLDVVKCVPDVFVSLIISEMDAEAGELSEEARSCLRELVIDLDWSAILAGAQADILAEFLPGLIVCALELLLLADETVPSDGDDYGDLIDDATPVAFGEAVSGTLEVDGDADVFVFEAAAGESYQIDVAPGTLEDPTVTLNDADGFELAYNDDYDALASRLYWEAAVSAPLYVGVEGYGTGTGTYTLTVAVLDFVDDHSNLIYDATPVAFGAAVSGTLEVDGDADVFVFEAAAGESYQIDVTPGTLEDPTVTLNDADGFELAYNDDYDALASRLYWEAADSAPLYVGVEGYGTGTYTLTVAVLDFVDDHSNLIDDATPVAFGAAVSGTLEVDGDADVFVFEAAAGESYQIDVAPGTLEDPTVTLNDADGFELAYNDTPGTLEDPTVTLNDADGFELAYNDDYGGTLASRLYWEAADSAPLYVGVEGYGTGTYTLTVAVLDFVDDHGDRNTEATPAALGEAMAGVRDYDEDVDVFMFEAVVGELYQIDVTPGTLEDPTVTLRDADGFELAYNDDHAETPASRLYWEATNSGPHYVAVSGHDTGTYTLTIAQR